MEREEFLGLVDTLDIPHEIIAELFLKTYGVILDGMRSQGADVPGREKGVHVFLNTR